MNNYELQQQFLDLVKKLALENPDKEINSKVVYSLLIRFNVPESERIDEDIKSNFSYWMDRYKNNRNIEVTDAYFNGRFLVFKNGHIDGNEIKLYVPLDKEHLKQGADYIFDFISSSGIYHQSKVADIMRNDNVVIRVNSIQDANMVMQYIDNNSYIKDGLLKVNPFLPNNNGIGVTMDNNYSYNTVVSQIISNYYNYLKQLNRLDLFTVSSLNNYINEEINSVNDLDEKDIYNLISQTTSPGFNYEDFLIHAERKSIDLYDYNRNRIQNPYVYLDHALKVTEKYYPGNAKIALIAYTNGVSVRFTRKENARAGLTKYVNPNQLVSLMKSRLIQNGIEPRQYVLQLIDQYLDLVFERRHNFKPSNLDFSILKNAYVYTEAKYGINQARAALQHLIMENNISYFTNDHNARTQLALAINRVDIKQLILNNVNIQGLDINNCDQLIWAFENVVFGDQSSKQIK